MVKSQVGAPVVLTLKRGRRISVFACAVLMSLGAVHAARADDAAPTTQERVGYALSRARSAAQGDKQALASLQTDAAIPDAAAEFGLGQYYAFTQDYPQSVTWFKRSAGRHFAGGYYGLGKAYESGDGVPRDYAQAMRLFLQATELPEAEMRIGDLYAEGKGVEEDDAQTVIWYRKAAEAGSVKAQLMLGAAYEWKFWHLQQDRSQALQWYLKAADQGDAGGEESAGLLYEQAGPLQDYKQAAQWLQKASQQGVAEAQYHLGVLYAKGQGVPVDAGKAVQQFQMAANQGQPQAQIHLAQSFAEGSGVPADPFRAYEWSTIAEPSTHAGDADYVLTEKMLRDLERQMNPAQVSRAKQAAAEWREKHRDAKSPGGSVPEF